MFDPSSCGSDPPEASRSGPDRSVGRITGRLRSRSATGRTGMAHLRHRLAQAMSEIRSLRHRMARARYPAPAFPRIDAETSHPHEREVAVVFVDLRGFTTFVESSPAAVVMATLAEYHATLGGVAMRHGGILERFAGDGMLFYFEAITDRSDAARRAARMVLQMNRSFGSLRQTWRERGIGMGLGIGVAAGRATVGPIGFEERHDYAVIGTTTNLAARLSSEAIDGQILICANTRDDLTPDFRVSPLGLRVLKGFREPLQVFALGT